MIEPALPKAAVSFAAQSPVKEVKPYEHPDDQNVRRIPIAARARGRGGAKGHRGEPGQRAAVRFTPGVGALPPPPSFMAVLTGRRWRIGRTLRVRFLGGDPEVRRRLQPFAHQWSDFANIKFVFGDDPDAEIRVAFADDGSWSCIGTDALARPPIQATMNYGWLTPGTDDTDTRVVIHEFGHALGCIHEHSSPAAGIPWDKEAVYRYYQGPPNNWSRADVDFNLFQRYSQNITQFPSSTAHRSCSTRSRTI